jgi:glucose-6-phosphate 1-dehydrogenase
LLGDAIKGDGSLFSREDAVEEAWRVLDPILDNATPVHVYDKYTWGPEDAYAKLMPEVGWYNPDPPPAATSTDSNADSKPAKSPEAALK